MTQHNVCSDGMPERIGCVTVVEDDPPSQPPISAEGKVVSVDLDFEGVAVTVTLDHEGPGWAPWIDLTTGFRYGQTLRGGFVRVE